MPTLRRALFGLVLVGCLAPASVLGAPITFSGTITYDGPYNADSLYVAVLDTTAESRAYLIKAYPIGNSPITQAYSLTIDNAGVPPGAWIASVLDVDGEGVEVISAVDVVGWYDGNAEPVLVSTLSSQSGLDFALPTGEIRGTVTFASGQTDAEIWTSPSPLCEDAWPFTREGIAATTTGPFAIIGVYPGTWCLYAYGHGSPTTPNRVCHGDFTCANPTLITLSEGQVVNDADLTFIDVTTAVPSTWGRMKSRY